MTTNIHRSLEIRIYVFGELLDRNMLMYKFHFDFIHSTMHIYRSTSDNGFSNKQDNGANGPKVNVDL